MTGSILHNEYFERLSKNSAGFRIGEDRMVCAKVKILAVDDRMENLLALQAVLDVADYDLVIAHSGEEALRQLLLHDFALILLDVQMPGLNGFETAKIIRKREKSKHIPIIFISAIRTEIDHVVEGYSAGAIDYIFKPYQPETLQLKVEGFVSIFRRKRQIEQQRELLELIIKERTSELIALNEELVKSYEQTVSILESISDAFYAVDHEWRFTYLNKEAEKAIGEPREQLVGKVMWDAWPQTVKILSSIRETLEQRQPVHLEAYDEKGGQWYEMNFYPAEKGMSVYFRNINDRRQYEREMIRLDRLNLIGEVAAGIAHEIRNPLTTVKGYLQLFISRKKVPSSDQLNVMVEEIDRANGIITEFLSLAKNKNTCRLLRNLSGIVEALFPLLQAEALLGNKILDMQVEQELALLIDEKEIRQLILNLVLNGLDAMDAGGRLTISTYKDDHDVILSITDQGHGIHPDVLEKIGTPFFTTKENGTGLGLAMCYSIAARHNAKIEIDTSPQGTTFLVRFPPSSNTG
jgi:PAS domain S-box-containing protein